MPAYLKRRPAYRQIASVMGQRDNEQQVQRAAADIHSVQRHAAALLVDNRQLAL